MSVGIYIIDDISASWVDDLCFPAVIDFDLFWQFWFAFHFGWRTLSSNTTIEPFGKFLKSDNS